jgi:hypothetical protein
MKSIFKIIVFYLTLFALIVDSYAHWGFEVYDDWPHECHYDCIDNNQDDDYHWCHYVCEDADVSDYYVDGYRHEHIGWHHLGWHHR